MTFLLLQCSDGGYINNTSQMKLFRRYGKFSFQQELYFQLDRHRTVLLLWFTVFFLYGAIKAKIHICMHCHIFLWILNY